MEMLEGEIMGDYCSVASLKSYRDIAAGTKDSLLSDMINAAEQYIDTATKRHFRIKKVSWRLFDPVADVESDTLLLDYDMVKDSWIVNGDGSTVAVADRILLTRNSPPYWGIKLRRGSWKTSGDIRVRAWWGYSRKAPQDIVQATRRLAAYLFAQKDSQVFEVASFYEGGILTIPEGVPAFVQKVINKYTRAGVA